MVDTVKAVDFPHIGDRVAYEKGDNTGTVLGRVVSVAAHDGDADIAMADHGYDPAVCARDVKRGYGPHTYQPLDVTR